jgi:hypothetical protein
MAHIQEEIIVIKLSKLVKDIDSSPPLTDKDFTANIEAVVQELAGPGIVVELEKA